MLLASKGVSDVIGTPVSWRLRENAAGTERENKIQTNLQFHEKQNIH